MKRALRTLEAINSPVGEAESQPNATNNASATAETNNQARAANPETTFQVIGEAGSSDGSDTARLDIGNESAADNPAGTDTAPLEIALSKLSVPDI